MASALPGVWGIDLGQCALKALRLQLVDGTVVATAFDYVEHPKILSQPDADPDQLTRAALEQFLSRNQIKGDQIAISVPGQTGLARFVKLPPVEAKKIPDIVRFEAKQQIPFPLEEVVWDWQTIGSGGLTEEFVENEIGLFAMKRDMVNRYLQAFKDVNVEVHFVQMSPLALCNYVTFDVLGKGGSDGQATEGEKGQCVVALDIGADNTNLIVTDGDRIIWQRPIPIGGNHFTRALTKDMKLTFAKAEHLKRNATKAEDPRKIFQSMKPVFSDFAGELQRSLGFFSNTHRQAQIKQMVGQGNAFRLPGLQKFLSQSLGVEMGKIEAFNRLKGDEVVQSPVYSENVLSFSVAYGLALQGLGVTRLRTNLLPQEIQFERLIRAKKPWAAVAAASLLVGTTIFAIFAGGSFSVAKEASDAADKSKGTISKASDLKKQFQTEQEKLRKAREDAAAILRGGRERTNWAIIHRYINECLPQPDASNVPPAVLNKYWTTTAEKANKEKKLRDEEGIKDELTLNELIQVNLQAIWARYCGVAEAANWYRWTGLNALDEAPLRHADWKSKKPPAKPGWAMEVRGYTYHIGGIDFVRETFMDNLRERKRIWFPLHDPQAGPMNLEISHVAIVYRDTVVIAPGNNPGFAYLDKGIFLNEAVSGGSGAAGGAGAPAGVGGGGASGSGAVGVGGPGDSAGGGGGGGMGGVGSSKRRDAWVGLGSSAGSGSGGFGGAGRDYPGRNDGGGSVSLPGGLGGFGGNTGPSGGGNAGAGGNAPDKPLKAGERKRTEFIIFFYWQEPLPSEPKDAGGDQDAGMEGGSGGMPAYPGAPPGYGPPGGGYPNMPGR